MVVIMTAISIHCKYTKGRYETDFSL